MGADPAAIVVPPGGGTVFGNVEFLFLSIHAPAGFDRRLMEPND